MSYAPQMRESVKRVEATRPVRLQETFPMMEPQEKQTILQQFHPDYKLDGMREIRLGINRGERMPMELAEVMEGASHLTSAMLDLKRVDYSTDVLVIGGGGAGSSAALMARENGARVIIANKLRHGDANTIMAQGGIQAADKPSDSPAIHYLDVMGGGHFTNHPKLVEALVRDAPLVIKWLEDLGYMFDKDPDPPKGARRRKKHVEWFDVSAAEVAEFFEKIKK